MILFDPTPLLPKPLRRRYTALRVLLLAVFLGSAALFAYRVLFPSQEFVFSFENPDTSKNTLEDPVGSDGKPLRKGHLTDENSLHTYAGTVGSFSSVKIALMLERDSAVPDASVSVALRKSYRAFFSPEGDELLAMPKERGFIVGNSPYLFSGGKLFPFISDAAALSWFEKDKILPASEDLPKLFPIQEEYAGFRPGSLLSDTEGVYVVGGDEKAHPIGSTSVFETLGFHWSDVVPVSEEELRLHARGKILLLDAAQPDGTLFFDRDTGRYFLMNDGAKHPIGNAEYLDSLRKVTTPIEVSGATSDTSVRCDLTRTFLSFWPFRHEYVCTIPLETLRELPGGSFEVTVDTPSDIHAATLFATFMTEPDRENFSLFLRQIRERFTAVYGK